MPKNLEFYGISQFFLHMFLRMFENTQSQKKTTYLQEKHEKYVIFYSFFIQ